MSKKDAKSLKGASACIGSVVTRMGLENETDIVRAAQAVGAVAGRIAAVNVIAAKREKERAALPTPSTSAWESWAVVSKPSAWQ
jgi:hypothetical protein